MLIQQHKYIFKFREHTKYIFKFCEKLILQNTKQTFKSRISVSSNKRYFDRPSR